MMLRASSAAELVPAQVTRCTHMTWRAFDDEFYPHSQMKELSQIRAREDVYRELFCDMCSTAATADYLLLNSFWGF